MVCDEKPDGWGQLFDLERMEGCNTSCLVSWIRTTSNEESMLSSKKNSVLAQIILEHT
jgi:hypothetical protein